MKLKTPTLGVILMTGLPTALGASAPNARILMVALCLMLSACNDPFAVMSGGELNGTVSEVPESWELDEISALAQLETRPSEPYSINLVYVQMNGQLYIYAGDNRTNWVQHIEQDPRIRIRINETIYPARAVRVTNDDEISAFAAIWTSRGFFQRDPLAFDEVWLYRLTNRRTIR